MIQLMKKPLGGIYEDTLDHIYLSSKKRNISISGPHLTHLFAKDDKLKTRRVFLDTFINKLHYQVVSEDDVSEQDLKFMASKYLKILDMQHGQLDKYVDYT